MKFFLAISFVLKTILSIAGIVLLINKLNDAKNEDGYKFTIDSAINKEGLKSNKQFSSSKKNNFSDLHKSYFQSMDYLR